MLRWHCLYLQFGFVIFWQKNIGAKAARKMLVKFAPDVPLLFIDNKPGLRQRYEKPCPKDCVDDRFLLILSTSTLRKINKIFYNLPNFFVLFISQI